MEPLPTVIGPAGMIPLTPTDIQQNILSQVDTTVPGWQTRLPGVLGENMTSVEVLGIAQCDSARVETVNSLTPRGANAWLLQQLGDIYGVPLWEETNTSVYVVFTAPNNPGFVIPAGFTVSDGVYSYVVQDGGAIGSGGQSLPLFCVATLAGAWSIAPGTVTEITTSVPLTVSPLTCSNPYSGTPSTGAPSETQYRSTVLTAGKAAALGMPSFVKTQLLNVPGVQPNLISVQQQSGGGWMIIVGGTADPYQIAWAIYRGIGDVSSLVGSQMTVANITNAANAQVTTVLNHGFSTGQIVYVNGITVGMLGINGQPLTVTVIDEKNFTTGFNSVLAGPYEGGGVVTPNFRNNFVALQDYPDVYVIPFVAPPLQTVTMAITWNTIETNFVNVGAISQLAAPAISSYVNSIYAGQPMNLFVMQSIFQTAVASILPAQLLTRLIFEVSINGVGVAPLAGTGEFVGDIESYFSADPTGSGIVVTQG